MAGLNDASVPWPEISRYMLKAHALVQGREPNAVNWGDVVVDWALTEVLPDIKEHHRELIDSLAINPDSPLKMLLHVRESIAISNMPDFPDATWPELFACYGIGRIGRAQVALQRKRDLAGSGFEPHPTLVTDLDGQFLTNLLEATEAIQLAQQLVEIKVEAKTEAKLMYSTQQSKKAIKRHATTRELHDRFEDFYARHGDGNKSKAAREFLTSLDPDDRRKLTRDADNAVTTLTRGLRKRQKENPQEKEPD